MKFKKGKLVEVLRREHDTCGSWFPGNIVSVDGNDYVVRYKFLLDDEGEPVLEKIHGVDIRPLPLHEMAKRWRVGDIAEVFDNQCWRMGKIAKVLPKNRFVIRLFGSIQLKEFSESNIRIWKSWHNNQWSETGKVALGKQFTTKNDSIMKRRHADNYEMNSRDQLIAGSHKKRKSCPWVGGHKRPETETSLFRQVADISFTRVQLDEKFIGGSTEMNTKLSSEDSKQCSVASCSSIEFADCPGENVHKSVENISNESDAESSFPSLSGKKHEFPSPRHKLEAGIHELELQAYQATVLALYASGPLSWEQESLLTNLRVSLNISDEEHLLQLRHLLSAQVV